MKHRMSYLKQSAWKENNFAMDFHRWSRVKSIRPHRQENEFKVIQTLNFFHSIIFATGKALFRCFRFFPVIRTLIISEKFRLLRESNDKLRIWDLYHQTTTTGCTILPCSITKYWACSVHSDITFIPQACNIAGKIADPFPIQKNVKMWAISLGLILE